MLGLALILLFPVFISSYSVAPAVPSLQSSTQNSILDTAYLNSSATYYTNHANTSSGSETLYAFASYYPASWMFYTSAVGTTQSVNASDEYYIGNFQYYAGTEIGDGGGSYENGLNLTLYFQPGLDSNLNYNVGTVYASLILENVSTGTVVDILNWTWFFNAEWSYNGYRGVEITPYWFGSISGYFSVLLYVAATPYTNYAAEKPANLATIPNPYFPGASSNTYNVSFPGICSDSSIVGWVYSGLIEGGSQYNAISTSFSTTYPSGAQATQLCYVSPYSIEMAASNSYGVNYSSQSTSGVLTYSNPTYLPNGGWFLDVAGNPNVAQFNVRWNTTNVVVKDAGYSENLTANSTIIQNQNWFNATGPNALHFALHAPPGALNGAYVDGAGWNTNWIYTVSHLMDTDYGSPVNDFYVNGSLLQLSGAYNSISGQTTDSNRSSAIELTFSTENLVNYKPVLESFDSSSTLVFQTQPVTIKINTSEQISGEADFITVYWGDGSYTISNMSTYHDFSVTHSYLSAGSFTPALVITNSPNAEYGALDSSRYNLSTVEVVHIGLNATILRNEANPYQPVIFSLSTSDINFPQNDTIKVDFGDGSIFSGPLVTSQLINHSYSTVGSYSPVVNIMYANTILSQKILPTVSVIPVQLQLLPRNNTISEKAVRFSLNYSSLSNITKINFYLDYNNTRTFFPNNTSGSVSYCLNLSKNGTLYVKWIITTRYNYTQYSTDSYNVNISAAKYNVTFVETGLISGTKWHINLSNGQSFTSTSSTMSFSEFNGTFSYGVSNTTYYYATPFSGYFTVNGNAVRATVVFTHYSYITGIISPSTARLTVNGVTIKVTGGAFNMSVVTGTYKITASLPGYKTFYENVTLLPSQASNLNISLHAISSIKQPLLSFSSPLTVIFVELGVVIVVVTDIIIFLRSKSRRKERQ